MNYVFPHGPRVLLIDSELPSCLRISADLIDLCYTIVGPAFAWSEALDLATTAEIDLALIALKLEGKFSGKIAEILFGRKIPFLFITDHPASTFPAYPEIAFLSKPFAPGTLQDALKALIPK